MGERGNIAVIDGNPDTDTVYLYTHWRGYETLKVAQDALRKKWRWDDAPYLARIIFDELVADHGNETGYGISTRECDPEYDTVYIDVEARMVTQGNFGPVSFASFIEMELP